MKYVFSWVLSFVIFLICWVILSQYGIKYIQDPSWLMIFGVVNYFISDKISGIALLHLTSAIPVEQEEIN